MQKLICNSSALSFHSEVNKLLEQGWHVVQGTHVGCLENVATGSTLVPKRSEKGYFAIVLARGETSDERISRVAAEDLEW